MKFSELVTKQTEWEKVRHIVNPNDNLDRTQVELDEAKAEADPMTRLIEMVDACIVLSGGMGRLLEQLGEKPELIDQLLEWKLAVNDKKYSKATFDALGPDAAIAYCRDAWSTSQSDIPTPPSTTS